MESFFLKENNFGNVKDQCKATLVAERPPGIAYLFPGPDQLPCLICEAWLVQLSLVLWSISVTESAGLHHLLTQC